MKNILPLIGIVFLSGFLLKGKLNNIELLLNSKKIKFEKSDSLDIVKIFGPEFDFKTSWKHAKLRGGDSWNWTYYYYDYSEWGIQFRLMKQVGVDESPKLCTIHLYRPYKYLILGTVKVGETKYKELRDKFDVEKLVYSQDRSDTLVSIEQKFKSYTFKRRLKILLDENMEEETVIRYLDSITSNQKIECVDICKSE